MKLELPAELPVCCALPPSRPPACRAGCLRICSVHLHRRLLPHGNGCLSRVHNTYCVQGLIRRLLFVHLLRFGLPVGVERPALRWMPGCQTAGSEQGRSCPRSRRTHRTHQSHSWPAYRRSYTPDTQRKVQEVGLTCLLQLPSCECGPACNASGIIKVKLCKAI